jgi:uncharacterized RDD family membrane protein YckC
VSESGSFPPPPPDPSQGQAGWGAAPPPPPPPGGGWNAAPPPPAQGQWSPASGGAAAIGPGGRPLAEWPKRAVGLLIDVGISFAIVIIGFILAAIFGAIADILGFLVGLLSYLAAFGWILYQSYQAGETGQSLGMQQMKIRLLSESTGQHVGGGMGIARYFVHIVDSVACYVGWLWPLWDDKKQTFADKILSTVVVDESAG